MTTALNTDSLAASVRCDDWLGDTKLEPRVCPDSAGSGRSGRSLYRTILADPPWKQKLTGKWKREPDRARALPYPTMTVPEICALPIGDLAANGAHLWLWTTNEFLEAGFEVMRAWGFRYLAPVTWVKPSGVGAWFVHRTQTLLFGYRPPLVMAERYKPTVFNGLPGEHSAKPHESYQLIEAVSESPRVEIFARPWTPLFERRHGWDVWGNQVVPSVELRAGGGGAELVTSSVADSGEEQPNDSRSGTAKEARPNV